MERRFVTKTRMAFLAAALALGSVQAYAQQGVFDLPVSAHWATSTLEPGTHKIDVPVPTGQTYVYLQTEGAASKIALPLTIGRTDNLGRSYLHLAKVDGQYYVDEYHMGNGNCLYFMKPKAKHPGSQGTKGEEETLVKVDPN